MKAKTHQDEIPIEQLQKQMKQNIFELFHVYLQQAISLSDRLYYLLILIETLQILFFSVHPELNFFKSPIFLPQFRQFLSYLNFEAHIRNDPNLLPYMIILAFSLVMLEVVVLIISVVVVMSRVRGELWKSLHKVVAIQFVLINTIFTIPIFNVSIITLYCDASGDYYPSDYVCYNLNHIVLCALAGICLLVIVVVTLLNWLIFYDKDPTSRSFLAVPSNLSRLGKMLVKILPPIYFVIDVGKNYQNVYIFIQLALVVAYIFFLRMFSVHNYNQIHFYVEYFLEGLVVWFSVNTILNFYLTDQLKGKLIFIQTLLCGFAFSAMLIMVEKFSTEGFFMENVTKEKIKKQNMEKFMFFLLDLFYSSSKSSRKILYIAIKVLGCHLNSETYAKTIESSRNGNQTLSDLESINNKILHNFFKSLNWQFVEQSNSVTLKILNCYILYSMKKKVYSIHKLMQLYHEKLSLSEEFLVFRFCKTHSLLKDESDYDMPQKNNTVENYFKYTNKMNQIQKDIEDCTKNNIEYWKELTEDSPSFAKVKSLSSRYHEYMKKIHDLVCEIQAIFSYNKIVVFLYYQFLINVGISIKERIRISEKISNQNNEKLMQQDSRNEKIIKFKQNENLGVICISTAQSDFCTITSCNSQILNILGYEKSDLIGNKLVKIMPSIYHDIHDGFVDNYLRKLSSIFLPSNKNVFALKKNGRIVETLLSIKIIPHDTKGFELVGFLKKDRDKEACVMINLDTLEIEGVSDDFKKIVQGKMNEKKINFESMKINQIFPNLQIDNSICEDQEFVTELKIMDGTEHLIRGEEQPEEDENKKILIRACKVSHYDKVSITVLQIFKKNKRDRLTSLSKTETEYIGESRKNLDFRKSKVSFTDFKKLRRKEAQEVFFDELPLQHKLEDYIANSSNSNKIFVLGVLLFIFFIVIVGSSVFKYQITYSLRENINSIYQQTEIAKNISVYSGKIIIYNERTVNPFETITENKFNYYQLKALSITNQLQTAVIKLLSRANERAANLEINENKYYDFKTHIDGNSRKSISQVYLDGIFSFISLQRKIVSFSQSDFQHPLPLNLEQAYYYTMSNSLELFPQISKKIDEKYQKLFENEFQDKNTFQLYFAILKTVTCIILFLSIFFIIRKFDTYNQRTIEIYRKISIEDIVSFEDKCRKFFNSYLIILCYLYDSKKRKQYLENAFPKQSLISLAEQSKINDPNSFNQLSQKRKVSYKKVDIQQASRDEMDQQLSLVQRDESVGKMQIISEEKNKASSRTLLLGEHSVRTHTTSGSRDCVKLTNYNSMKEKYIISFVVLIMQFVFIFGVFILVQSYEDDLKERREEISNLGSLEKTVLFSFFYGYKSISEPNKSEYLDLFSKEFEQFYSLTSEVYPLIGDPKSTLRQLYTKMEALQEIVKAKHSSLTDGQIIYIQQIEESFFNNIEEIIQLLRSEIKNYRDQIINEIQTIEIVKLAVEMIIGLILCRIIQLYLFSTVCKAIKYSTYMLKMIPISLLAKNHGLKQQIFPDEKTTEEI